MSGALLTMTKKEQLDYLTVQMKRLVNGQELSSDSLDMMLWTLEDLSAKEAKAVNEPELFPVRHTLAEARARQASLKETQARQAAMRQGQL